MRRRSVPMRSSRPLEQQADRDVDRVGRNHRLVALDIDDEVALELGGDFGQPVAAGFVRRASHHRSAAEATDGVGDALVVGRHEDDVHAAGFSRSAHDVFDHRPAVNERQWFTGKATRVVAGRDDGDDASGADGMREP